MQLILFGLSVSFVLYGAWTLRLNERAGVIFYSANRERFVPVLIWENSIEV